MTVDTLSDEKLAEIARGCEGVTPGPWVPSTFGSQVLTGDSWNTVCIFYEGAGNGPIANAKRNFQLAAWEDGRGATRIDANAFHIARLDPSTVLSLVTEVQSSRATVDGLRAALRDMLPENCGVTDDPSGGRRPSFAKCERARDLLAAEASLTTARADGIEEAAKVADGLREGNQMLDNEPELFVRGYEQAVLDFTAKVRALSPPANEPAKDETEVTG